MSTANPSPLPKPAVLLWALTVEGEINATYCEDLAEAERFGRLNVASGAWRTWRGDAIAILSASLRVERRAGDR